MSDDPRFVFAVCQNGAEAALKNEFAREWPDLRFAFSRPGFVTFKLPDGVTLSDEFDPELVLARAAGLSLGRVSGEVAEHMADEVWQLAAGRSFRHVHVWQRDSTLPGDHDFEPGVTALDNEVGNILVSRMPSNDESGRSQPRVNQPARSGDPILDCVLVEPREWWVGFHRAGSAATRWPGGVPKLEIRDDAISRAYRKMIEGLAWSRFPMTAGDSCVEIGSSPGGSCQALLDKGMLVTGIDPANMDEAVLSHPKFRHVKKRGADLKRRDYGSFKWLMADSNVAPQHTLDTVEHIVTHPRVHIRGMLLTLKMLDWKLADEIPNYLARIRSWDYHYVRARQLASNRREICVVALRRRSMRRPPRR